MEPTPDRSVPNDPELPEDAPHWLVAVRAAESKMCSELRVLDLREVTTFVDHFVICNGSNRRQIQAIADEVTRKLKRSGEPAANIEGYERAEWILIDYGDCLVHVFSEKARKYYDIERLWRHARTVEIPAAKG